MLLPAGTVERNSIDDGMRRALQPLEPTKGRERHGALAPFRTSERVPRRQRVVHRSILDEREDVVRGQAFPAVQELELDDERQADDLPAELLDELDGRLGRSAGGEDVVVDDHALPLDDRVGVDLERVEAVLERVLGRHGPPRELAGLPRGDEAAAELARERAARDVPARLGAEDQVGLARPRPLRQAVDRLRERLRVGEQGHDVLEDDPGLGKVRNVPDLGLEIDAHCPTRCRRARQKRSWLSSCASSASPWRSSRAPWRASGFRERSLGTSASSRSAWLPAAVANLRRWRTSAPAVTSLAHTAAVSASAGVNGASSNPYSVSSRACAEVIPASSQSSSVPISVSAVARLPLRRRRSFPEAGDASSCRITRSGRNSSRWSRRIVSSRSMSSSPN